MKDKVSERDGAVVFGECMASSVDEPGVGVGNGKLLCSAAWTESLGALPTQSRPHQLPRMIHIHVHSRVCTCVCLHSACTCVGVSVPGCSCGHGGCEAVSSAHLLRHTSPQRRSRSSLGHSVQKTRTRSLSCFPALSFEQRLGPSSPCGAAAGWACENLPW